MSLQIALGAPLPVQEPQRRLIGRSVQNVVDAAWLAARALGKVRQEAAKGCLLTGLCADECDVGDGHGMVLACGAIPCSALRLVRRVTRHVVALRVATWLPPPPRGSAWQRPAGAIAEAASELSPFCTAIAFTPLACRIGITLDQDEPSANAPWIMTTVGDSSLDASAAGAVDAKPRAASVRDRDSR